MTTSIKVLRENLIKQLSGLTEDNIAIADIQISRKRLLEALKLQRQADILTISYGKLGWHYDYENYSNGAWKYEPFTKESESCIQFSCDHTIMRFFNRPKPAKYGHEPSVKHLNFIEYQEAPESKPELTGIALDTQELIKALEFAMSGVGTDEFRAVLCCVLFDCGNDAIKLVSADGFRLPVATIPAPGIATDKILIHSSDITHLIKFLKSTGKKERLHKKSVMIYPDTYLSCNQDTNQVKFTNESEGVTFERREGTYPDYAQLIPKDGTKIEFIASQLLEAVKPLVHIAKDGSGIIRLQFKPSEPCGKIMTSARSEELGDSIVECDAKVEADCRIALNAKYLTDVLSYMGDNIVTLRLTTPSSPMVFETGNGLQETIMPMFVQWGDDKPTEVKPIPEPEDLEESEPELTQDDIEHINELAKQSMEV